jgi:hypothetical protein
MHKTQTKTGGNNRGKAKGKKQMRRQKIQDDDEQMKGE